MADLTRNPRFPGDATPGIDPRTLPLDVPIPRTCIGVVQVRKRDRDGELIEDRSTPCTERVDIREKTGRYCQNCLVPMMYAAYVARARTIDRQELLLEILTKMPSHELVYVRDDPVQRPFADYILATRGYDPFFLIHTWNGAVYDLRRLAAMMEQERLSRPIISGADGVVLPTRTVTRPDGTVVTEVILPPSSGSRLPAAYGPISAAIQENRVDALQYAVEHGEVFTNNDVRTAARMNRIDIVRWRIERASRLQLRTVLQSAMTGAAGEAPQHLRIIELVMEVSRANDLYNMEVYELFTYAHLRLAANHGRFDVIDWYMSQIPESHRVGALQTVANGGIEGNRLDVVQYVAAGHFEEVITPNRAHLAASLGNIAILQWILEQSPPETTPDPGPAYASRSAKMMRAAANGAIMRGQVGVLQYLVERGWRPTFDILILVGRSGTGGPAGTDMMDFVLATYERQNPMDFRVGRQLCDTLYEEENTLGILAHLHEEAPRCGGTCLFTHEVLNRPHDNDSDDDIDDEFEDE